MSLAACRAGCSESGAFRIGKTNQQARRQAAGELQYLLHPAMTAHILIPGVGFMLEYLS
jgi:hypothetical protein